MAEKTSIEWADSTFNPWIGCAPIGPGCDHCYAAKSTPARTMGVSWGAHQRRHRTEPRNWAKPLRWEKHHETFMLAHGRRRRVFCASLADVFDNAVPPEWRADLFRLIEQTPHLDWLLLTKRIGNVPAMVSIIPGWMPPNVWLGATVTSQAEADRDIPKLLAVPAARRFLSMEPLLGPVDLTPFFWGKHEAVDRICQNCPRDADCECGYHTRRDLQLHAIDWVIVGGESGPHARPMHPDWVRSLRDQCVGAGVPYFFKQWGAWGPASVMAGGDLGGELRRGTVQHLHAPGNPPGHFTRGDVYVRRLGKKRAGRLLDGRTWDEVPA